MLQLQSIHKRFGSFELADVSLKIEDGEYFVLLGPSGVGKTVMMEIIAGLIRPDNGRILWNDADISTLAPESRRFGLVYQDYALFPHLTVEKNIAYGLRAANAGESKKRISVLADMLHIRELLGRYPNKLSGGEQQRVALARALAVEPGLLLLDEPLSALDVNTRLRLRKELKRISRQLNLSIFHITHDPEEALTLADKVCVMLDGKVRQIAPAAELFRAPSDPDVAKFLGMKNILPVSQVRGGACSVYDRQVHANAADETTEHIWIMPEEILVSNEAFGSSARNQFKCNVTEMHHYNSLLAVQVACGGMKLTALITYRSCEELKIKVDSQVYVTFKSSAVHCF